MAGVIEVNPVPIGFGSNLAHDPLSRIDTETRPIDSFLIGDFPPVRCRLEIPCRVISDGEYLIGHGVHASLARPRVLRTVVGVCRRPLPHERFRRHAFLAADVAQALPGGELIEDGQSGIVSPLGLDGHDWIASAARIMACMMCS